MTKSREIFTPCEDCEEKDKCPVVRYSEELEERARVRRNKQQLSPYFRPLGQEELIGLFDEARKHRCWPENF